MRINGAPFALPFTPSSNSYYFVVTLFTNTGANPIHITNDQSFGQTGMAKIMYITSQGRWFTGYSNSRGFNNPLARLHLSNVSQNPSVFTDSVANVTQNTAIPYGRALAAGPAAITSRGFCYNTTGNPTISSSTSPAGSGPGSFNNNLSGLSPNTTYFVKAYATTSLGTTYGNELSFTTSMPGMPTLSTDSVANIANNSATAFGTVVSNGGSNLTARGFCYNTSGNPSLADNITTAGIAVGGYSSILSGLSQNTTYFIKSYATNSAGTAYGNELSFTTTNIGLEILNAAKIKVYPNPGQHKVYVDAPIGSHIQLIDLQGRVWRSTTSQNPQTELLLSDLASGTYIIEVESEQRITQVKWVKP